MFLLNSFMLIRLLLISLLTFNISLEAHSGHNSSANDFAFNCLHWLTHHSLLSGLMLITLLLLVLRRHPLIATIVNSEDPR